MKMLLEGRLKYEENVNLYAKREASRTKNKMKERMKIEKKASEWAKTEKPLKILLHFHGKIFIYRIFKSV